MNKPRLIFSFLVAAVAFGLFGATASAHAVVISSDPAPESIQAQSPTQITVGFDESVSSTDNGVSVVGIGANGLVSAPFHPDGDNAKVAVHVLQPLANGYYIVSWRVLSADSHLISGSFRFGVGPADELASSQAPPQMQQPTPPTGAQVVVGVGHAFTYTALIALLGAACLLALTDNDPFALVKWFALVGAMGVLLLLLGQAALISQSWQGALGASGLSDVVSNNSGRAWVARLPIYLLMVLTAKVWAKGKQRHLVESLYAVLGLALAFTISFGGHGASGRWVVLGLTLTAFHVIAIGVWLGGLGLLGASKRLDIGPSRVKQFSSIALVAVIVLIVTGELQAIRQLRTWDALVHTGYGQVLIVKSLLVLLMLLGALASRMYLRRSVARPAAGEPPQLEPKLHRSIQFEALLGIAVIVATSVLVSRSPTLASSQSSSRAAPVVSITGEQDGVKEELVVDPARVGVNKVTLTLSGTFKGSASKPQDVTLTLNNPNKGVLSLVIPLQLVGDTYVADKALLPASGTWKTAVSARYDRFSEVNFQGQFYVP